MNLTEQTIEKIKQILTASNVLENEPLKNHTTMKVGGPAALFATPETESQILDAVSLFRKEQIPFYVLGNGSNVICRDEGYEGVILCLADKYKGIRFLSEKDPEDPEKVFVSAKAGTKNSDFSEAVAEKGLSGFEFASGIPGSVGGAATMNAGAYDGEIRQIVHKVRLLDREGNILEKSCEEMNYGYRRSIAGNGEYLILEVVFALRKGDPAAIRAKIDDLTERRKQKQPLEYPSCGSTFKRPEGYFAGKLISDSGLKGFRLGGAQVSEKHAGFVINRDQATAKDVLDLITHVQEQVKQKQGVSLECEVRII